MKIQAEGILYVEGPAIINKESGTLIVAGAEFDRILVPRGKGTAIRLPEKSELEVTLLEGGSIRGTNINRPRPEEWDEVVETVKNRNRILIVGPVDSGKSFLSAFLINKLSPDRFVDTDLGQGAISPPTTIGAAKIDGPVPFLSYLTADRMYFVGATTPSKYTGLFLSGVKKIVDSISGRIIIDTTGRIHGEGARLKVAKAEMFDAKVILIEKEPLDHIKKALDARGIDFVSIPPLSMITERSRELRKEIRSSLYSKRLSNAKYIDVSREKVYGRPFYGKLEHPEQPDVIARRVSEDKIIEITESGVEGTIPKDYFLGLIVGAEKCGFATGIGYIYDITKESITIACNCKDFDYVRLGLVKINPETLEEAGWLSLP